LSSDNAFGQRWLTGVRDAMWCWNRLRECQAVRSIVQCCECRNSPERLQRRLMRRHNLNEQEARAYSG
jgi:hypothetical protein